MKDNNLKTLVTKLLPFVIAFIVVMLLLGLVAPKDKADAADLSDSYNGVTFQEIYNYADTHSIVPKNSNLIISLANNGQNINGKPAFYVNYITTNGTSIPFVQSGSFYKSSTRYVQNYYTVYWTGSQWSYQGVNTNFNDNIWLYKPSNKDLDEVVYTSAITISFNGSDIVTPPPAYEMHDYVTFYSSGAYDFNLDVMATEDSIYYSRTGSYVTDRYIAYIGFNVTVNGNTQSYTYLLPTYKTSFPYLTSYNGINFSPIGGSEFYSVIYQDSVATYTRTSANPGMLYVTDAMLESGIPLAFNADEAQLNKINNRWTIRQVFEALAEDYPTVFTDISVMMTNYHYYVYDCDVLDASNNPTLAFEGDIDYSSGLIEEIPEDDPNILNLTENVSNVLNQLGGVQYMMSTLTGKSTYIPKDYETSSLPSYDAISAPEFNYENVDLDDDSLGFFSWLVNFVYTSPVSIFCMCALGFLVAKTVLR